MEYLIIKADEKGGSLRPITVPDDAIDISHDRGHMRDAIRGDNGAWGRMSKGRRAAIEALNEHELRMLLEHLASLLEE